MKASTQAFLIACLVCGVVLFWPMIMLLLGTLATIGLIGGVGFIVYTITKQYLAERAKTK